MKRKIARFVSIMLIALLLLPQGALGGGGGDPWDNLRWKVRISYDLDGGAWPAGQPLYPHTMEAKAGESMAHVELEKERSTIPTKPGHVFAGWRVVFTDSSNGPVIYDSGNQAWDLNHPFDYYPNNPLTMDCRMIALWQAQQGKPGIATGLSTSATTSGVEPGRTPWLSPPTSSRRM